MSNLLTQLAHQPTFLYGVAAVLIVGTNALSEAYDKNDVRKRLMNAVALGALSLTAIAVFVILCRRPPGFTSSLGMSVLGLVFVVSTLGLGYGAVVVGRKALADWGRPDLRPRNEQPDPFIAGPPVQIGLLVLIPEPLRVLMRRRYSTGDLLGDLFPSIFIMSGYGILGSIRLGLWMYVQLTVLMAVGKVFGRILKSQRHRVLIEEVAGQIWVEGVRLEPAAVYDIVIRNGKKGGRNIRLVNPERDYDSTLLLSLRTDAEAETAAALFRDFLARTQRSQTWPPAPAIVTEEPSENSFQIALRAVGPKKINVIKIVRESTGLGLKECKDLVETAPCIVMRRLTLEDALSLQAELEDQGAMVKIEPA